MILHQGNYWEYYDKADLFLFTGNGTLSSNDKLVMGAGTALQVKNQFPGIDQVIGHYLKEAFPPIRNKEWRRDYYFIVSPGFYSDPKKNKIGIFQTKGYWKQDSSLNYIRKSVAALQRFLKEERHSNLTIYCPFPGIGNGNLSIEEVLPTISHLPDNVIFWIYEYELYEQAQTQLRLLQASLATA